MKKLEKKKPKNLSLSDLRKIQIESGTSGIQSESDVDEGPIPEGEDGTARGTRKTQIKQSR